MKATFDRLSETKRQKIINSCVEEFGERGYEMGSTDGIIKRSGISKGGLYEYVRSKEELFLFTVDYCYRNLYDFIKERVRQTGRKLPGDILDRFQMLSRIVIDYYISHLKEIRMIVKTGRVEDPVLGEKLQRIFLQSFLEIFGEFDTANLRYQRQELLDLLQWMLVKTRNDLLRQFDLLKNVSEVKEIYLRECDFMLDIFRHGIYGNKNPDPHPTIPDQN